MKTISMIPFLIAALLGVSVLQLEAVDWKVVLGPPQGEVPEEGAEVIWRDDLAAAFDESRSTGKPLLVTFRCLPCKQCAEFDKEVLEGSPELTPRLSRFVTVRLTDAAELDERIFRYREFQDLDLSWWGWFLSPEGETYGIFGGKDHVSDATRISETAFVNTLDRILAHHYDPRRKSWGIDGEAPVIEGSRKGPLEMDTFPAYAEKRPWMAKQECVHCHQVGDMVHFDDMEKERFDLRQLTQPWPLPENVGILVDRDHGLLVEKVYPGSPAAKAGLEQGDRLAMAGDRRLFGQADFRGVLHRASFEPTSIPLAWSRDGTIQSGTLETGDDWKAAENSWRKTVYDGIYGVTPGFFPIKGPRQGKGAMSFRPFMGPGQKAQENPWWPTGLRPGMEIIEINGKSEDWDSRQFLAWFRLNHEPGDTIRVKVNSGEVYERTLPEATEN